jgi:hypothetical protein
MIYQLSGASFQDFPVQELMNGAPIDRRVASGINYAARINAGVPTPLACPLVVVGIDRNDISAGQRDEARLLAVPRPAARAERGSSGAADC